MATTREFGDSRRDLMKDLIDRVGAVCALVLVAPVIGFGVVAIRLTSPGPGIFSQERIGRDGAIFRCHKLRTMSLDAPTGPTHEVGELHVTSLGAMLRRTKLDELPQVWNILRGEMSFVGPRPCLPSQTRLIEERRRLGVLALRPGITGLAQVEGIDMSDPVRLAEKDAEYLQRASVGLDLNILAGTIRMALRR